VIKLSSGNKLVDAAQSGDADGYMVKITNSSISSGQNTCTVALGKKATTDYPDGVIKCEEVAAK
jgi:hypothetical protein